MKDFGDGVRMYDTFEEMIEDEIRNQAVALAGLNVGQQALCDEKEHFCFSIDGFPDTTLLAIVHVRSKEQVLAGKYPEDAPLWFGPDGGVKRGLLPSQSWDGFYNRPGGVDANGWPVNEGDLHDWHALKLMEITREEFGVMAMAEASIDALRRDHHFANLLNEWIGQWRDRNGIPR